VAEPGPTASLALGKRLVELALCTAGSGTQIGSTSGVVTVVMEVGHALAWPFSRSHIRERRGSRRKSRENSRNPRIPRLFRSSLRRALYAVARTPDPALMTPFASRFPLPARTITSSRRDVVPRPGFVVIVPMLSVGNRRSVDNPYRVPGRFRREMRTGSDFISPRIGVTATCQTPRAGALRGERAPGRETHCEAGAPR
jgi:hypothetical protein